MDREWVWLGLFGLGLFAGGIIVYMLLRPQPSLETLPLATHLSSQQANPAPVYNARPQAYTNKEKWSWNDWKGRERSITVERNAKVV